VDIPALPTEFRGEYEYLEYNTDSTVYVTALDLTGSGMLYWFQAKGSGGNGLSLRITIDDNAFVAVKADALNNWIKPKLVPDTTGLDEHFEFIADDPDVKANLNIDYKNNLKIEVLSDTVASTIYIKACYSVD